MATNEITFSGKLKMTKYYWYLRLITFFGINKLPNFINGKKIGNFYLNGKKEFEVYIKDNEIISIDVISQ